MDWEPILPSICLDWLQKLVVSKFLTKNHVCWILIHHCYRPQRTIQLKKTVKNSHLGPFGGACSAAFGTLGQSHISRTSFPSCSASCPCSLPKEREIFCNRKRFTCMAIWVWDAQIHALQRVNLPLTPDFILDHNCPIDYVGKWTMECELHIVKTGLNS